MRPWRDGREGLTTEAALKEHFAPLGTYTCASGLWSWKLMLRSKLPLARCPVQMLWLLFLTLPFLGSSKPMAPDPGSRRELVGIVGGCKVSARKHPWQVSLRFFNIKRGLWQHECGGSLIHPQWVLTAAHCVAPVDLEACSFRVQVGQLRLYDHDQLYKVTKIIRHPKFNYSLSAKGGADIALLKLETPVPLSEDVSPVTLPSPTLRVHPGTMCWVTGWGDIADNLPLPPPYHLQEVAVPIVGNKICDQQYRNFSSNDDDQNIKDDMLCAGGASSGFCKGDFGGPLVCSWNCTWVQVGVVSWGQPCGCNDFPGVYTRVTSYVSWIWQHVPPNLDPTPSA